MSRKIFLPRPEVEKLSLTSSPCPLCEALGSASFSVVLGVLRCSISAASSSLVLNDEFCIVRSTFLSVNSYCCIIRSRTHLQGTSPQPLPSLTSAAQLRYRDARRRNI